MQTYPFLRAVLCLGCCLTAGDLAADVYGPKPFKLILESTYARPWTPTAISAVANRAHVVLLDAATKSTCLSITAGAAPALTPIAVTDITSGTGTYGTVMRSLFQLLDRNVKVLSTESLTGTYTVQPDLFSYDSFDADAAAGAASSTGLVVRDRGSHYATEQDTVAYLVFTFTGTPTATKIRATSRYVLVGDAFVADASWSSTQWLTMDSSSVGLTSNEGGATEFYLADATGLIDFSMPEGSDFNPAAITWQTNSFASFPVDPMSGESLSFDYADNPLNSQFLTEVDPHYQAQFGAGTAAGVAAAQELDAIAATLAAEGASLRYSPATYLAFRDNLLSQRFGAVDIHNAKWGERTVEEVYFTNAADDAGVHHPFMVIASYDGTPRPNFLIDVARPPGDGLSGGYAQQSITRNAILENKLVKIPLRDYGLISTLTENDLTPYSSLAADENVAEADWDVYTYASPSSSGIATDGVVIYPATNNTLAFATAVAEVTSSGAHVGRGMGLHYHADGHAYNPNGINLYNLADYAGHTHPPLIGFAYDGVALFGRYESSYSDMDGYSVPLDEYGGHSHGTYGYHYHTFDRTGVVFPAGPGPDDVATGPYTQHFLLVGAWRGRINSIPGFMEVSRTQFLDDTIKRYVGAVGTVDETASPYGEQPQSVSIAAGETATFGVDPTTATGASLQWYRYRFGESAPTPVPEATTAVLVLPAVSAADAGFYFLRKTNGATFTDTTAAVLAVAGGENRLANLSLRGIVPANGSLTAGFVTKGTGAKPVLVRALGPTLTTLDVVGALPDPILQLVPQNGSAPTASNDNWFDATNLDELTLATTTLGAYGLSSGTLDAALLTEVALPNAAGNNGNTMVITSHTPGESGIVVAEVYDADTATAPQRLVNLSALGYSGSGDNLLITGFVISGTGSKRMLIRVVGPSVASLGVADVIADPRLTVVPLGQSFTIGQNDNWGGTTALQAAFTSTGAFALDSPDSLDAAILLTLPPGGYTVQVAGAGGATGNVLVEVYDVDN